MIPEPDKADAIKAVEFRALIKQIKTMVDHSTNIIINIPEYCTPQAKALFDLLDRDLRWLVEDDSK